eukprot:514287-Rhodomonas_salina.1
METGRWLVLAGQTVDIMAVEQMCSDPLRAGGHRGWRAAYPDLGGADARYPLGKEHAPGEHC